MTTYPEEFKALEEENKRLETHLKKTKEAFIDNNKIAYNDGFSQGRSYQAICEIRGRERFTDSLDLCAKCRKQLSKPS